MALVNKNLVENVFLKYGFSFKIVSDSYSSFTGDKMKQINKILKINHVFTSPYTPSSNVVERFHKTLGSYLRTFINENSSRWVDILPFAIWSYNNTTYASTNYIIRDWIIMVSLQFPEKKTQI